MKGMVLGKFMPPHLGHLHLVEFARAYCDEVCVFVEKVPGETIPSELRWRWMQQLCPDCTVLHLVDLNPQDPSEHPDFWQIWRESLLRNLPFQPDAVIASEAYGARLARELGAEFVPADLGRSAVPVSGTAIRQDPMRHWRFIPRVVRPHFVRRVRIVGPESTGKSTLAKEIAEHFDTVHVPEYAAGWIRAHDGAFAEADLLRFAKGQVAAQRALASSANRVLICDTDAQTTALWSDLLYGRVEPSIQTLARSQSWHLTLLCAPDVPYADDVHRVSPQTRAPFMRRLERALKGTPERVVALSGAWPQRRATAIEAVQRLIDS